MKYFKRTDGLYSQVNEVTNPTVYKEYSEMYTEVSEEEYINNTKIGAPTKEEIDKQKKIYSIKKKLNQLSEDIIQYQAGEKVPDIIARRAEFIELHNELRGLEGKSPREIRI